MVELVVCLLTESRFDKTTCQFDELEDDVFPDDFP
jgi:hypothetical protein